MLYNINALKVGLKIIQNNEPCVIIKNECVKPGKGQAFNRIRFRQIISGRILEKTLKSGECLRSADVVEINLLYMYYKGGVWYFINEKDFEQIEVDYKVIRDCKKWMKEQLYYLVTFWNRQPILVTPPDYIELKVISIDSVTKTSVVSSSGTKWVTVNTGAIVRVPFFVNFGDLIKINTRSGTYVSRVREFL